MTIYNKELYLLERNRKKNILLQNSIANNSKKEHTEKCIYKCRVRTNNDTKESIIV